MNQIIELTKSLIQFQSVHSRPEEIKNCAAFIEIYLKRFDIDFQGHDFGGTPSILVSSSSRNPQILLMSHFDVVEGSEELFAKNLSLKHNLPPIRICY